MLRNRSPSQNRHCTYVYCRFKPLQGQDERGPSRSLLLPYNGTPVSGALCRGIREPIIWDRGPMKELKRNEGVPMSGQEDNLMSVLIIFIEQNNGEKYGADFGENQGKYFGSLLCLYRGKNQGRYIYIYRPFCPARQAREETCQIGRSSSNGISDSGSARL